MPKTQRIKCDAVIRGDLVMPHATNNLSLSLNSFSKICNFQVAFLALWVQHPIDSYSFHPLSTVPPIPQIPLFQNCPWKSKVKAMDEVKIQGHIVSPTFYWLLPLSFIPCQLALPFLKFSFSKIWPWKTKVKTMDEVKVQSHIVGPASYSLTFFSLHANQPSPFWAAAISKFDLENERSSSWVRSKLKVT